jgi:ubiquinone biosynthesis protein UbiJ
MMITTLLLPGVERALNAFVAQDESAHTRVATLAGRVVELQLRGTPVRAHLCPQDDGRIQVVDAAGRSADACIEASPLSLLRLSLADDSSKLFFEGDVVITGDVALGQAFRDLLLSVDIDWEEELSRVTGDVLAHQVGNAVRGGQRWARASRYTLEQDAAEYLQEESRLLVTREESGEFLDAVDSLREDVDRLAVRVQRLAGRLQGNG